MSVWDWRQPIINKEIYQLLIWLRIHKLNQSHLKTKTNTLFHMMGTKPIAIIALELISNGKDNSTIVLDQPNYMIPIVQEYNISKIPIQFLTLQLDRGNLSQATIWCLQKIKYSMHLMKLMKFLIYSPLNRDAVKQDMTYICDIIVQETSKRYSQAKKTIIHQM